MLYVIFIGLWSDFSAFMVSHVSSLCRMSVAVMMSGEVGHWLIAGILIGVSMFKVRWFECIIKSAISVPLLSVVGEYHSG